MEAAMMSGFLWPLVLAMGCCVASSCGAYSGKFQLTDFRVISRGQDEGGDFCRDFNLTPAQVSWIMRRAKALTAPRQHSDFDHLPCWVRGTARRGKNLWQWEVRAGGTVRLVTSNGTVRLLGCSECDSLLRGQEEPLPK